MAGSLVVLLPLGVVVVAGAIFYGARARKSYEERMRLAKEGIRKYLDDVASSRVQALRMTCEDRGSELAMLVSDAVDAELVRLREEIALTKRQLDGERPREAVVAHLMSIQSDRAST